MAVRRGAHEEVGLREGLRGGGEEACRVYVRVRRLDEVMCR